MARTIRIASREYRLTFDKNTGASFWTHGSREDGRGEIRIGLGHNDLRNVATMLVHEILESILVEDCKRYRGAYFNGDDTKDCMFVFDHDYLNDHLDVKVVDALLSSGFFKLTDGRQK